MKKVVLIIILFEILSIVSYSHAMGRKSPVVVDDTDEGKIASHFNVSEEIIIGLKSSNYTDEDIIKVLVLSTAAGKSVKEITDLIVHGESWEEIAKSYDIPTDTLDTEVVNILLYYGKIKKAEEKDKKEMQELLAPKKPRGRKLGLEDAE